MQSVATRPIVIETQDEDEDVTVGFCCTADENKDRGNWSGQLDFLASSLGYIIGLGSVWRFPYLVYKHGGAVFLIPYILMLVFVGMPLVFLELSLGQFTSQGPLTCWEFAPICKGIGVGMVILSGVVGIYYNMIIAWCIFYLFASTASDLPWEKCTKPWAGPWCGIPVNATFSCTDVGLILSRGVCWNASTYNPELNYYEPIAIVDQGHASYSNHYRAHLPSQDYLNRRVIMKDLADIDHMGPMSWELVMCYLAVFIIVGASLIKGVKSLGKVAYFVILFPYLALWLLLIRSITLPGYYKGIQFYLLEPDLTHLHDTLVWKDAAVQIFFSLSVSWGGLISMASYNRFHYNCVRDTLILSIGNSVISFFAGFMIFSFLGFLATYTRQVVPNVVDSGTGLAFIVIPEAMKHIPLSQLWCCLFFFMLITIGLGSTFGLFETVMTSIKDQFPKIRPYKSFLVVIICVVFFLLGLPLCTWGGSYLLQLLDSSAGNWNVLVIAILECFSIAYIYAFSSGYSRFKEDIQIMVGKYPCLPWGCCYWFWMVMWLAFTPQILIGLLLYSWIDYDVPTYGDYIFPTWAISLGWCVTLFVIGGIVFTFIAMAIFFQVTSRPLIDLVRPSIYWGPALGKHRQLMLKYKDPIQVVLNPWIINPEGTTMEMIQPHPYQTDTTHGNEEYVTETRNMDIHTSVVG